MIMTHESMVETSVDYGRCTADIDAVSLVKWNDEAPTLFINLKRDPNKPGLFNCYNSESLRAWLANNDNVFAEWVTKPGQIMDNVGHGGSPDLAGPRYIRLYTPHQNIYLQVDDTVKKIADGTIDFMIFDTDYLGKKRLGNLAGAMTVVSALHGQLPGEDVYKLVTPGQLVKGHFAYVPSPPKAKSLVVEVDSDSDDSDSEDSDLEDTAEELHERLIYAIKSGWLAEARLLIEEGADVEYAQNDALFTAIRKRRTKMIELLIEKGADTEQYVAEDDKTPLSEAMAYHNIDAARILVEDGVNVNLRNSLALVQAVRMPQYIRGIEFLLANGAKITKDALQVALKTVETTGGDVCARLAVQLLGETANLNVLPASRRERVFEIMRQEIPLEERNECYGDT